MEKRWIAEQNIGGKMKLDWLQVIITFLIIAGISFNVYWIIPKDKTIEYKDKIIIEKEECILNCTETDNQIKCRLPEGKTLNIIERTNYEVFIK